MTPRLNARRPLPLTRTATAVLLALSIAACSGGDDNDEAPSNDAGTPPVTDTDADGIVTLDIDATAGGFDAEPGSPENRWAYLDLDTGRTLDIDDAAADTDTTWDIAFKRVDVRLNGGASGPADVRGGIADAQLGFYDEEGELDVDAFVAANADEQREAIVRPVDAASIEYVDDVAVAGIVGDGVDTAASWWIYDPATRSISANPSAR